MSDPWVGDWLWAMIAAPFVGSFLGVLILRIPGGEPVAMARSACPHCRRRLRARDLIPLVSWLAVQGRCRRCGVTLGCFYPAIELAAVLVPLWAGFMVSGWLLWLTCGLGWALLALAVIDQRHLILPDQITVPLLIAGLTASALMSADLLTHHLIGAAAGFASFALVAWAYRRLRDVDGLGLGDAKLLSAAGAYVSWQGLPSIVLLAAAGALASALLRLLLGGRVGWQDRLAFGPFLCAAIWLVWLYGPLAAG